MFLSDLTFKAKGLTCKGTGGEVKTIVWDSHRGSQSDLPSPHLAMDVCTMQSEFSNFVLMDFVLTDNPS